MVVETYNKRARKTYGCSVPYSQEDLIYYFTTVSQKDMKFRNGIRLNLCGHIQYYYREKSMEISYMQRVAHTN